MPVDAVGAPEERRTEQDLKGTVMLTIILIVAIVALTIWVAFSTARIAKVNALLLDAHARIDDLEAKVARKRT
jgi:hypothetical protein